MEGLDVDIDFAQVINRSYGNTKQLFTVLQLCSNSPVVICSTTFAYPVVQTGILIEFAIAPIRAGFPLQRNWWKHSFHLICIKQSTDAFGSRSSELSGFSLGMNTGSVKHSREFIQV